MPQLRRAGNPYGHDGCAYCVLAEKVGTYSPVPTARISSQLLPVRRGPCADGEPIRTDQSLKASPNAQLLGELVAGGSLFSHDLLDELPPSRNVHYVRRMIVQAGVLPERHEDLERLPAWLDHHLLDKPDRTCEA